MVTAADVVRALDTVRFSATTERRLQYGIAAVLESQFPGAFEREVALTMRDRPDFLNRADGIVLEVKHGASGGSVRDVFAQLQRYAEHPMVRTIVLATPSRRVATAIPPMVGGIPVSPVVLHLGF
jgi:hypothetical protein